MKRLVGLVVLMTLVAGLLALAGCGAEKGLIVTPQGTIKFDTSKNEVVVTSKGEKVTWKAESTTEKALGVPIPNEASLVKGTAILVSGSNTEWAGASFTTPEGLTKVIDWYKSKLKGVSDLSDTSTVLDGQAVGLFSFKEGSTVKSITVSASKADGKGDTAINVASVAGAE